MNLPDSGLPSDLFHFAKKYRDSSSRRGETNGTAQLFMGGALIYIGASMALKSMKCDDVRKLLGLTMESRSR
jgi:hypothetical protein